MLLWSWHEPNFSLTSGRVDHSKSEYYQTTPGIPAAYAELAERLGTDQIVWCCLCQDEHETSSNDTRVEWTLQVPDDAIIAIVDSFIWNKILGSKVYPLMHRLRARCEAPIEEPARTMFIRQQEKDYHSQPEPIGGWWSQLFIADTTLEGATALLKHPIPESWVISDGRFRADI